MALRLPFLVLLALVVGAACGPVAATSHYVDARDQRAEGAHEVRGVVRDTALLALGRYHANRDAAALHAHAWVAGQARIAFS